MVVIEPPKSTVVEPVRVPPLASTDQAANTANASILSKLFKPASTSSSASAEPRPAAAAVESKPDHRPLDTMPVPDFVIRPPSRGAMLPALIEPRADRRMSYVLIGALALLVLLAVAGLAFHNVIADQLPIEWRNILRFDA
jgi:hypothetical protein